MPSPQHRIRQAVFELSVRDEATAFLARKRLEETFHDTIVGALGQAFDSYAPNGEIHRIEQIEIDLGVLDLNRIDSDEIRRRVLGQLSGQFQTLGFDEAPAIPRSVSAIDALVRFLKTGTLPWDAPTRSLAELEEEILESTDDVRARLSTTLSDVFRSRSARIRFAYQFSVRFYGLVLRLLRAEADEIVERLLADLGGDLEQPRWRVVALEAVATALGRSKELFETEVIYQIMERVAIVSDPTRVEPDSRGLQDSPFELVQPASRAPDETEHEALYTRHAGIALLHPFLDRFFAAVDLLHDGKSFPTRDTQMRAVHLLHFLATGSENPEEHEVLLEKVLCGYPIEAPIPKELELTSLERDEAESLLRSVIEHWSKLKNTSSDGLREGFLIREGRLELLDGFWELAVEQKAHDVLLDSLPWGLHIISLPWMSKPLQVNWA